MNNVSDPLLSGEDLPTFKFALEESEAKVIRKSIAREAIVAEFPISKEIAGVSIGLEPGAMRELHWHAAAARSVHRGSWSEIGQCSGMPGICGLSPPHQTARPGPVEVPYRS